MYKGQGLYSTPLQAALTAQEDQMPAINRTVSPAHQAMRMVGGAIQQALPAGSQYVLIVYDDPNVVDRKVSFVASESEEMAVARIKEFVKVLDR